ncbi:MAG: hypothetical protein V1768_03870 [Patescibacteria group bacterium]
MAERPVHHRKQPGKIEVNRARVIGGSEARTKRPSNRKQDCACSLI